MNTARELVIRTAAPFFQRGAKKVFVTECHDRVYVGTTAASGCRTCNIAPKNVEIAALKDLDTPSQELTDLLQRIESKCAVEPSP